MRLDMIVAEFEGETLGAFDMDMVAGSIDAPVYAGHPADAVAWFNVTGEGEKQVRRPLAFAALRRLWPTVVYRAVDGWTIPVDDPRITDLDTAFQEAWVMTDGVVFVDMDRARAIYLKRLRDARKPLLAALDVAYQRADETGDTAGKQAVIAKKQRLRDAPNDPRIAAAQTPAALAALTLDALTA